MFITQSLGKPVLPLLIIISVESIQFSLVSCSIISQNVQKLKTKMSDLLFFFDYLTDPFNFLYTRVGFIP